MARNFVDEDWATFTAKRPEYASAEKVWTDVLQPELVRRDADRSRLIKSVVSRAVGVGVPVFLVLLLFGFPIIVLIILTVLGAGAASALPAVQIYGFKSGTKDLVLSAATQSFGFTYDTLHTDVSGVNSWGGLRKLAVQEMEKASSRSKSATLFSTRKDTYQAPTPAFAALEDAGLFPHHDNAKFEDLIEGERAGATFSLVECKLTDERGSGKDKRTVTVFEGILVHIAYPERFLGRTVLARSGTWKWGKRSWKDLEEVKLVSIELDKAFTVYSNDQVEARTLLTPDRMERLIALERFFSGGKLRGIFEGDHLTVALEAGDQFEVGSMFETLNNPAHYKKALHELGLVCDLIDGFLTRGWALDKL